MSAYTIQSLSALEEEMRAVARGEKPAPANAASPSFTSVEALARLLTAIGCRAGRADRTG